MRSKYSIVNAQEEFKVSNIQVKICSTIKPENQPQSVWPQLGLSSLTLYVTHCQFGEFVLNPYGRLGLTG